MSSLVYLCLFVPPPAAYKQNCSQSQVRTWQINFSLSLSSTVNKQSHWNTGVQNSRFKCCEQGLRLHDFSEASALDPLIQVTGDASRPQQFIVSSRRVPNIAGILKSHRQRKTRVGMVQMARFIFSSTSFTIFNNAFSALTLLVGRQEGHPACKN